MNCGHESTARLAHGAGLQGAREYDPARAMLGETPADELKQIEATLAGDANAFELLVIRYEKEMAQQMWRFSRDAHICAELVQEVFVRAYMSLRSYRPARPFLGWLRGIAVRVGWRYLRSAEKQTAASHNTVDLRSCVEQARLDEPCKAAEVLHAMLARLGARDRLVLTLIYFEDCDVAEVAERTGWHKGVVAMRAHRARQRLRTLLEREELEGETLCR